MKNFRSAHGYRLTLGAKSLLILTTSAWRPDELVSKKVGLQAERLLQTGWWIRLATPRNYLLWRQYLDSGGKNLPVVVLVHPVSTLTVAELNVMYASELFEAENRIATRTETATADIQSLDHFCADVVNEMSGLIVVSRRQVFASAQSKILGALGGY